MSSYAMSTSAQFAPQHRPSTMYDDTRAGSGLGQVGVAIVAIVLAIVLIVGQVALATTRDIASHLHESVANLAQGNTTMLQVIDRARPNPVIGKALAKQSQVLAHTSVTLTQVNVAMAQIIGTTNGLSTTVGSMQRSSNGLAGGVSGMARDSAKIASILGKLPDTASKISVSTSAIDGDSKDINTQLGAIEGKMKNYGLPQAKDIR